MFMRVNSRCAHQVHPPLASMASVPRFGLRCSFNSLLPTDIGPQPMWNRERAIRILVVLQNRDEDTRARDDRVVQRVAQAHVSLLVTIFHVQPSRLELVEA